MATRRIKKEPIVDVEFVVGSTQQYLASRNLKATAQEQEDRYKRQLMEFLSTAGTVVSDKGHRVFEFAAPLDGGKLGSIIGIRRTRRVTQRLDELRLTALLAEKKSEKLQALCIKTIEVVDEDGVLNANYQGFITDEELGSLYDESESFAFELTKDKG